MTSGSVHLPDASLAQVKWQKGAAISSLERFGEERVQGQGVDMREWISAKAHTGFYP